MMIFYNKPQLLSTAIRSVIYNEFSAVFQQIVKIARKVKLMMRKFMVIFTEVAAIICWKWNWLWKGKI